MAKNQRKKLFKGFRLAVAAASIIGAVFSSVILTSHDVAATTGVPGICDEYQGSNPELVGCAPEGGKDIIESRAQNIINWLVGFGAGIAVLFVIAGGIQMIIGGGDPEKVGKGKKTIVFALVGLVIAFFAAIIVNIIFDYTEQAIELVTE